MSRQSTGTTQVITGNIPVDHQPNAPGEWQIAEGSPLPTDRYFRFGCPLRPGQSCSVYLKPHSRQDVPSVHTWQWDGNLLAPTLAPSINCIKDEPRSYGCGWHGHVTGGVFKLA